MALFSDPMGTSGDLFTLNGAPAICRSFLSRSCILDIRAGSSISVINSNNREHFLCSSSMSAGCCFTQCPCKIFVHRPWSSSIGRKIAQIGVFLLIARMNLEIPLGNGASFPYRWKQQLRNAASSG